MDMTDAPILGACPLPDAHGETRTSIEILIDGDDELLNEQYGDGTTIATLLASTPELQSQASTATPCG